MTISNPAEAKRFVESWMGHRGVSGAEITQIQENIYFQLNGMSDIGIGFTVFQPKTWETTISVIAEVKIGEPHLKIFETMRTKDREGFMLNLIKSITNLPANYAFDPTYETAGYPRGIQFAKEIYYDNLTEDKLGNSMLDVIKCVSYVLWLFRVELGEVNEE
ncbi:DUF2299 family protein [Methanotrichaceae archaeon M04Ac]|jgi:hypothetical protein|uniref:DUF2299 family protein n=1 Tax=Candidatus Methanocrinis alkalitolerans TaxID=3033395 RepID=A0ABT5XEK1_9EURY|nr:DUF2299 family protein [Candidatus Methanocrinis alkalitolerans]MDF0593145.1 DUF2299 family protein [Candidatus Methanocrinis alkalitolerans]